MKHLLLALALAGCGKDPPKASPPQQAPDITFDQAADRALAMSDDGWIVSRWDDGRAEHQGDSLLFTGMAMGVMSKYDCATGDKPEAALLAMLAETGGLPYRHPTLKGSYSLDGLLGLWWGIHKRLGFCPSSVAAWAAALPEHAAKVEIDPIFRAVLDQVLADAGLGAEPGPESRGQVGAAAYTMALTTVARKEPAFRIHLGYLALGVVDAPAGKAYYCDAVKPAAMPLAEELCGRDGLGVWLQAFRYDEWEYSFQRSPVWETPDGEAGLHTPGIDRLVAELYVDR